MEIPGLDTIMGLVGDPPMEIKVSYDTIKIAEGLRQVWNKSHIAFIPYCMKCKEPLVWISPPANGVLFKCPKCDRKWIKDKKWIKDEQKERTRNTKKS